MKTKNKDKIRMSAILIVSLFVIVTGTLFSYHSFKNGEIVGGVVGTVIALTILAFAISVYRRGNRDIKEGFPLQDESLLVVASVSTSRRGSLPRCRLHLWSLRSDFSCFGK